MPAQDTAEAAGPAERERLTVEVGGKRLEVVVPGGLAVARGTASQGAERVRGSRRAAGRSAPAGSGATLVSPMQGTIIKIAAEEGQRVSAGDVIVVLEAMKMEQPLTAHKDGTVTGLAVEVGQTVSADLSICQSDGLITREQDPGGPGTGTSGAVRAGRPAAGAEPGVGQSGTS